MLNSLITRLRRLSRKLVTRVILIAALALLAQVAAVTIGHYIPDWFNEAVGTKSLDTILRTLATTMLAVTTFSLSVMTSAYQSAAASISHRTRIVLRADTTVHSVLATFVGAFLFALIGIILRATPWMGERESAVLFVFTIIVVGLVVISIIQWINHLELFGALDSTLEALQDEAGPCITNYASAPALGARPLDPETARRHAAGAALTAPRDGYVQYIFLHDLQARAEAADLEISLAVGPGDYVTEGAPLMFLPGPEGEALLRDSEEVEKLRDAITLENTRSLEQDPRFCLTAIAEVAVRALSPGINDPHTAVDAAYRLGALLRRADPAERPAHDAPAFARLWLAPVEIETLYQLSLDLVRRDAGSALEVHAVLAEVLEMLVARSGPTGAACARARLEAARQSASGAPLP